MLFISFGVQFSQKSVDAHGNKTIFIMGDSKARYYQEKEYPRGGWGQELTAMVKGFSNVKAEYPEEYKEYRGVVRYESQELTVENWSKSHESLKTFREIGRTKAMMEQVQSGDYVLVAFGHNDARRKGESISQYKKDLSKCIKDIRAKRAKVILITTPPQNHTKAKNFKINAPVYYAATIAIGKKYKVPCIDLNRKCVKYFNYRGKAACDRFYLKFKPGQVAQYPEGKDDPTHFTRTGAKVFARIIAVELQNQKKEKFFANQLNFDTKTLYRTYHRALKYKRKYKKKYTKTSWKKMIKARNQAWVVLYTPNATVTQCNEAAVTLEKAMKGLKIYGKN